MDIPDWLRKLMASNRYFVGIFLLVIGISIITYAFILLRPRPEPIKDPLHVDPDVTYPTFNPEKTEETETPPKIRYLSYGFLFSTIGFSLILYLRNTQDGGN